jgi:type III restriction enzyme
MIITWHAINKARRPGARLFSDAFLIVAPGITIRDRLQVLNPSDSGNVYQALNLVPTDLLDGVRKARIVITNYHAFMLREKEQVSKLSREILAGRGPETTFTESEGEMIARVGKELRRKNIIVLNDEAHHCYWHKVGGADENGEPLTTEEKDELNATTRPRGSGSAAWRRFNARSASTLSTTSPRLHFSCGARATTKAFCFRGSSPTSVSSTQSRAES